MLQHRNSLPYCTSSPEPQKPALQRLCEIYELRMGISIIDDVLAESDYEATRKLIRHD